MTVPLNVPPHVVEDIAIEQAVSRASSVARSAAHRSPSAIPAMELDEVVSQEDQLTSERYRSLLPSIEEQIFLQPQISSQQSASGISESDRIVVAVPLLGHQRDQYQIAHSTDGSPRLVLGRLRNIVLHPDLDNDEALSQAAVEPNQQLEWDIQCSAKFRWLKELIDHLRNSTLHIGLIVSPGKRKLLVTRFLRSLDVTYSGMGVDHAGSSGLRVTIIGSSDSASLPAGIDCMIALEDTHLLGSRAPLTNSPIILLTIPYSIDHIGLTAYPSLHMNDLLVLENAMALRQQAGRLDDGMLDISNSAELVATSLARHDWQQLRSLPQLPTLDLTSISTVNNPSKRLHEDSDSDSLPTKRMKSEDRTGSTTDSAPLPDDSRVLELAESEAVSQRLQDLLLGEQHRRAELEKDLGDLQYRFEELYKRLGETEKERDAAIKTAQQAVTRMNDQADNLRNLKMSMNQLREQLTECETKLASHDIPERAELEACRQAASKATENEVKATARFESIKKDLAYAQSLYQDASTKAQGFAGENTDLLKRLAVAEASAASERSRLRQMGYDNVAKHLSRENKQLRTMLELREHAITSRDEEITRLKDSNRGRMGTRGSSVPRSPRMSSPLMTMDAKIGSSRHGSPAAGEHRDKARAHPLRNG